MRFRPNLITFAVAVALSSQAHAAVDITSSLAGSILTTGPTVVDVSMSDPGTIPDGQSWISAYEFTGGYPSTAFFGERAAGNTIVRAVTKSEDYGTVTSKLEYRATVTNTGSESMPLSFLWHIGRGQVTVSGSDGYEYFYDETTGSYETVVIPADFSGSARLQSTISWGGATVWGVDLQVTNSDEAGLAKSLSTTPSAAGFTAYDHWSDSGYGYDEYDGDLGLGMLGAGESKELVYSITATVWYTGINGCDECFYGYGGNAVVGNTDPFQFEGQEVGRFGPGGVIVTPEPSTYAAMAVGLLGMGALARRRRQGTIGLC